MTSGDRNEGISVSGSASVSADVMAVGRNARATKIIQEAGDALEQRGLSEVKEKLESLLEAVSAHAAQLPNGDGVVQATTTVAEELAKDKPNRLTVTALLDGIGHSVRSVAEVLSACEALRAVVGLVFAT